MKGYVRADGRKGIRNVVVVAYLVECARHVAAEIAATMRERGVHLIGFSGCFPNDYADRMMTLSRIYGFWRYVSNLEREETQRYLEMLYTLQFRPLAKSMK